jgi:phytoene dehydrogenase-like protein
LSANVSGGGALSASARSELFAMLLALGAAAVGEELDASSCSGWAIAAAINAGSSGGFYPAGGITALTAMLAGVVESAGGVILNNVAVHDVVLEESMNEQVDTANSSGRLFATGVTVGMSAPRPDIQTDASCRTDYLLSARESVISGLGVISTYTKLLAPDAVDASTRSMLVGLSEMRPKVCVVYWLPRKVEGSCDDSAQLPSVEFSSTDFYESICSNSIPTKDMKFFTSYRHVWSPSAKDSSWRDNK